MGLVGFYPMPEFYLIFFSYTGPYILVFLLIGLALVPRAHRFIVNLTQMDPTQAAITAKQVFTKLPWYLLVTVTLYSNGGAFSADVSLEAMGIRSYTLREHLYNQFGLIPVVLITVFPIFFYFIDRLGRYLGPRNICTVAIPLWVKLLMLGIVTPLLIDSLLLGYYYNRTSYFHWETLGLWLSLLALAAGGTWLAWRSLKQGIAPLDDFISSDTTSIMERAQTNLAPRSLDELGMLSANLGTLLSTHSELSNQLEHAQSLADAVIENAGALVVVLDPAGCIVRFNQACEKLSGYHFSEVEGKCPWDTVLPPEDAASIRTQAFETLAHNPQSLSGEYTNDWLSKSGQRFLIKWSNTVLLDSAGKLNFIVSVGIDITESYAAKIELEQLVNERTAKLNVANATAAQSTQMLQTVLDTAPFRVFWKDREGRFLGCNRVFAQDAGVNTPEDLIGRTDWEMAWKASAQLYRADDAQVIESGQAKLDFDEPMDYADGSRKWLSTSKVPLRDHAGNTFGVLGTYIDITDRKHAELQLARNAQRLEAAQRTARLGDYDLDLQTNQLVWSYTTFELLGLMPGSVVPTMERFLTSIHPEDQTRVSEGMQQAIMQTYPTHAGQQISLPSFEYRIVRPDSSILWLYSEGTAELDTDGHPIRVRGTVQDITTHKHTEQALMAAKEDAERANKAKSEFLSRMSHELRTPMNAIIGFAQVLELEPLGPEPIDFVHEIHRAGDHLLNLINELLDLSRIEAGKLSVLVQSLSLLDVLNRALHLTQPLMAERQIALINHCDQDMQVLADNTRLSQILINLLSNATKYNHPGGRITLTCQALTEDKLRLSISDTGPGIPEEQQQKLFKPFERLGAEFGEIQGTGIGLALSKQLAELMGATIGVESSPGIGSTFWIDLSRAPLPATLATHANDSTAASVSETETYCVLYIEDNAANLRLIETLFRRRSDFKLLVATNGEQGLELAQHYRPDAILLDIHLPGMDGYAVLEALRSNAVTCHIPVLALSADAMAIDIDRGLTAGFTQYLTKPIQVDQLWDSLHNVLGKTPSTK